VAFQADLEEVGAMEAAVELAPSGREIAEGIVLAALLVEVAAQGRPQLSIQAAMAFK
jgi:hypothetical protein